MDERERIPQEIWETDCRYCKFRAMEENVIPPNRYERPCRIMLLTASVKNGHCNGCRPYEGFGICYTCEWFNYFHNEDDTALYCTRMDGPLNRRNTKPWVRADYGDKKSSYAYTYFTCDRYEVDRGPYIGKKYLLDMALKGKIPKDFDPETWQPLEYIEGEPIAEWEARKQTYEDNKSENIRKRALREKIRQKMKRVEE